MYIGIDLGTSGIKVILMTGDGEIAATASSELTVSRPRPLWSEQDPEAWWRALQDCMQQLAGAGDLSGVAAIGLSGQMHGATFLDSAGSVIRPAILWNDGRCAEQCRQIEQEITEARAITGNIVMPGFTAPKVLWLMQNEPANFTRIDKILLPKDYLRFRMCGDFATDMSDAAGTAWLDVAKRDWAPEMLRACGLNKNHMPALFEGSEITGYLSDDVAQQWGMKSVPVVAGAGDNAAGAIGVGVIHSGQAMLSLGTSGVYFAVSERFTSNPDSAVHSFCHALPDTWHLMSVVLSAASCLQWFADAIAKAPLDTLLAELENSEINTEQCPVFIPYLSGERTPHNDPNARGMFFGLTHETHRTHLLYAVLEGVSFALKEGAQALHQATQKPGSITLIGGGSKSGYWRQMLSDVLNLTLECRSGGEVGPALGAARLALLGHKPGTDIRQICPVPPLVATHQPDAARSQLFAERFIRYQQIYHRVKDLF
ncbi:xylulokinase [Planctobacterium marinum]|uniref:xylulokinase n=1 Tax=Planctobacterium marinum TaxID=1631968 RepID=UPI001E4065BF|nr:xylulokinase [Planctobacterium marinum]MCC2605699.1 xylulokinase [Planctobacterium marinum]